LIASAVSELAPVVGIRAACAALDVSRATHHRRRLGPRLGPPAPRPTPARALSPDERATVLGTLHAERFVDSAPAEVVATLLDEGTYLASERTMYRILAAHDEVRERRDQRRHPAHAAPELLATGPNELWSWDITDLRGPARWTRFKLYVILDVFSRYVPGWMVAHRESAVLAERLFAETCAKQGIVRDTLTVHADRGSSMTSRPVALLLADLGIAKTHGRPHVSNDNPYSEAGFKTLKYRPGFPDRFGSIEDARAFCVDFFGWYNQHHRHGGIAMFTPADVHHGRATALHGLRSGVLADAYATHPERFVKGPPRAEPVPTKVWINEPRKEPPGV